MVDHPRVFFLGPAGAGKTTALSATVEELLRAGWGGEIITIEDCQRDVCPRGREDGTYFYNSDGALVLLERERQAAAARDRFVERCKAAVARGFVAELGQPHAAVFLLQRLSPVLEGGLVVHVTAPLSIRKGRNEARTDLQMPEEVLAWIEEMLIPEHRGRLEQAGATVRELESVVPLDLFLGKVRTLVKEWRHGISR